MNHHYIYNRQQQIMGHIVCTSTSFSCFHVGMDNYRWNSKLLQCSMKIFWASIFLWPV